MSVLSFTGSRWAHRVQYRKHIMQWLRGLPPADEYVTGGCQGLDSLAGSVMFWRYPAAHHRVIVPANRALIDPWWASFGGQVEVEHMPSTTTYADRNARLVEVATRLAAFPEYPEDHERSWASGTWQTIRMAKRSNVPIALFVINGLIHRVPAQRGFDI